MAEPARKPVWKRVLSGVWTVVGAFLVAEVLLRLLSSYFLIYDLEMVKYATDLKVRSPLPGVVHQHRSNAAATLMGVDVSLNSMGHRSPELSVPKPRDERRIHFIGSSILLGWGVPVAQGMVARTAALLNRNMSPRTGRRYVGINAGIGNYNTFYEVELFARQLDRTKPDLVVLQYYINDAEPNPTGRDNPFIMNSQVVALAYLRLKSIGAVGAGSLQEHYKALYHDGQPDWERTKGALAKLKSIADSRGIPVVVLLVPEIHDFSLASPYEEIYRILAKTLARLNIPLINPVGTMREAFGDDPRAAWIARDDPHPSARVHEVLANALYRYIARVGL